MFQCFYIPSGFLSRFDGIIFYTTERGLVHDGAKNVFEAVWKAKKRNLFISRVWD